MAVRESNRIALRAAMERLLVDYHGPPQKPPTWLQVVKLSGVSRATSHRETELKEIWKDAIAERMDSRQFNDKKAEKPDNAASAHEQNLKQLRHNQHVMANHIQALSLLVRKLNEQVDDQARHIADKNAMIEALRAELRQAKQPPRHAAE